MRHTTMRVVCGLTAACALLLGSTSTASSEETPAAGPGKFSGTIYQDENANGKADPGEGLAGVAITMQGPGPHHGEPVYRTTTDADGRFLFENIPTLFYNVSYVPADGGIVRTGEGRYSSEQVWLTQEAPEKSVEHPTLRPLTDVLTAGMVFDKTSYRESEIAHLAVTLSNKGTAPVVGITAGCSGWAPANQSVVTTGPDWAPLRDAGLTLQPGETRVVDVREPLPKGAYDFGEVLADCVFGIPGTPRSGWPKVALAVPTTGVIGHFWGRFHQQSGPLANLKLVLLTPDTGKVVATTRTDAEGRFDFTGLPVGKYEFRLVGPWQWADAKPTIRSVVRTDDFIHGFFRTLYPGPDQPDPEQTTTPTTEPATSNPTTQPMTQPTTTSNPPPAARGAAQPPKKNLASTGADVGVSLVVGLGLLAAGLIAFVAARRRRTS